jgi:tyrosyl-tRNA synthetase
MSKSLGNAIGIHEPPLEMYGKIMSISDEIMWRYYELLTDVSMDEIEKMKRESHPMQAKKDLARRIVADFHSEDAATKAGEDWGKQFQKHEVPEDAEEVPIALAEIGGHIVETDRGAKATVRADRLLVRCGLAASITDAGRKLKQGSVRVDGHVLKEPYFTQTATPPMRLPLRVGKQLRIAIINW